MKDGTLALALLFSLLVLSFPLSLLPPSPLFLPCAHGRPLFLPSPTLLFSLNLPCGNKKV